MKKITLISLLLTLSVLTLKAQSYNSTSKEVRYEPDTIVVYDLDGYGEIVLSLRETYAYNELGLLTTREIKEWNPQKNEYTYENAMRTAYTYNDDNLRESEVSMYWNNETNNWLNQIKMEYEYSGNLPISVTHSYWNDSTNTFNIGDKYIFVYDEHNNMISSIIQSWDGSQWNDAYGYNTVYTYDKNFNIITKKEIDITDSTNMYYYSYTYDTYGNMLSDTFDIVQNGVKTKFNYNTYSYDNNHNLIQRTTMEWDETENDYRYASWNGRITYTYDENNNKTSHVRETYDYNTSVWEVDGWNPKLVWSYVDDNAILIQSFYFDETIGQWVNGISGHVDLYYNNMKSQFEMMLGGHQFEISYLRFETKTNINDRNIASISCYPNPSSDYIHIAGISEPTQLIVFDLSGKIIEKHLLTNNTETISTQHYKSGIYIIRLQNNSQQTIKKIVKK